MNKKMGFGAIFLLGINGIVGSGIFLLPAKMFRLSSSYSILLIFLAGLTALFEASCYANLSSGFSKNGAAWLYTYNAFGKFYGFEVGFFSWIQGVITIAAEVAAFTSALSGLFPATGGSVMPRIIGSAIIILLAVINCLGSKVSEISDNISSIVKILVLVLFVVICAFSIHLTNFTSNFNTLNYGHANQAFSIIFYMFAGFSFLPIAASKMKNSEKNLPKALISVILSVSVIYAAVQFMIIAHLGSATGRSSLPLADILSTMLGPVGKAVISLGMLIAIIGVALSVAYSTPYVASSLANDHKLLPSFFGKTTKNGTPYMSILITTAVSVLLVLSGSYVFLVSCVVFTSVIQYIAVSFSVMKFKKNRHGVKENFTGNKMPGGYLIPIIALLFDIYLISGFSGKVFVFGIINIIISITLYRVFIKKMA